MVGEQKAKIRAGGQRTESWRGNVREQAEENGERLNRGIARGS